MKIYFNGDSNVAGAELENPAEQGFAGKLAKALGGEVTNDATAGASNWKILETTRAFLQTKETPDLIVIGWTECFREDWFFAGKYRSLRSPSLPIKNIVDLPEFAYWDENMEQNPIYKHQMTKAFNRIIYNLHLELNYLCIPHLFFNAIDSFSKFEGIAHKDNVYRFDWGDCFFEPYTDNMSWREWAKERNFEEVSPGGWHFTEPCQDAWTELMYNYIKENDIV